MRPDAGADEARDRTDAPPELTALNAGWRTDRVPVVLQAEAAECGLACLSMIASAHGLRTDLVALRQRFPLSLKGATMVDLVRMAEAMQLQARALRAEPEDLPALSLPCGRTSNGFSLMTLRPKFSSDGSTVDSAILSPAL